MNGHGENSNLHFLCRGEVFFKKRNNGFSKKAGQSSGALVAHHFFSRSHSKIWHDAEIMLKSQRAAGQQSPVTIPVHKRHLVIPNLQDHAKIW